MSRTPIYTEAVGGGDRIWLDQLGIVAGVAYDTTFPGGDAQASWQITLDPAFQHRALRYGRQVGICLGASVVWHGYLDNPQRGTAWAMTAFGNAVLGKQYAAIAATSGNALNLNEVVDAAIARGLPWTRAGSLPTMANGYAPSGSLMIADALDQVADAQSTESYWPLDTLGVLAASWAAPTTPSYILYASGPGGGRNLAGFATDAYVIYQSATGVITTDLRSAASRPYGRFEAVTDQTGLGLIPSSQADTLGDGYLARNAPRAKFTSDFTVAPGQLVTMGGQPVDLATVRAGFLANVVFTDPDSAGEVALGAVPQVLFGAARYDVDADTLTLTPVYAAQDNLQALLGAGSLVA